MFGMQNKKPADISISGKCTMVLALFGPAFNLYDPREIEIEQSRSPRHESLPSRNSLPAGRDALDGTTGAGAGAAPGG
jgi:hypothetical protein